MNTREKGQIGEDLAAKHLIEQGYSVLARNLTCRFGEIDVIAQKDDRLYFVEIRRRIGDARGSALDSISAGKQARIRRTAEYLLFQNPQWRALIPYFSVIAIDEPRDGGEPSIEFLPDAFGY